MQIILFLYFFSTTRPYPEEKKTLLQYILSPVIKREGPGKLAECEPTPCQAPLNICSDGASMKIRQTA
jgi:hypothetical protein